MATDSEDDPPVETEVAVLPRETWERVKGSLENFEAFLEYAEALSNRARQERDDVEESGRSLTDVDRLASIKALEGTLSLAYALFPGQGALMRPLFRIYDALVGVNLGLEPDPILRADRGKKRPPHGAAVQRLKGEAAAALELYRKSGQNLKPASEIVARKVNVRDLEAIGYKASPHQDIKGRTIMDWRSEINQAGAQSIAARRYDFLLEWSREYGDDEAAGVADFILAELLTAPKKTG
jgi:hypothetical protein